MYFKWSQVDFSKLLCIMSLKIVFILANSADSDEMQQNNAAFHLGLHCLPKHSFSGSKNTKRNSLEMEMFGLL